MIKDDVLKYDMCRIRALTYPASAIIVFRGNASVAAMHNGTNTPSIM